MLFQLKFFFAHIVRRLIMCFSKIRHTGDIVPALSPTRPWNIRIFGGVGQVLYGGLICVLLCQCASPQIHSSYGVAQGDSSYSPEYPSDVWLMIIDDN